TACKSDDDGRLYTCIRRRTLGKSPRFGVLSPAHFLVPSLWGTTRDPRRIRKRLRRVDLLVPELPQYEMEIKLDLKCDHCQEYKVTGSLLQELFVSLPQSSYCIYTGLMHHPVSDGVNAFQ